jgi:hypothetical protein
MTKGEVTKEFFKKSIIPIVIAILLFGFFKNIFTTDGVTNYFYVALACGVPFGIGKMFTLIPIGFGISGTVGVVALNVIAGGLIGIAILAWKLAVAVWYVPLSIYRFVTE